MTQKYPEFFLFLFQKKFTKTRKNHIQKKKQPWTKPTNLDTPKSSPSSAEPAPKVNVPRSESNSLTTNEPSPETSKDQFDKVIFWLFWNLNGKLGGFDKEEGIFLEVKKKGKLCFSFL